jgi:hypothetical protein
MRSWGLSVQDQQERWRRWRQGESLRLIARRLGKRGDQPRRGRRGAVPAARGPAGAGTLDGVARTSQERRAYLLPGPGRRRCGLPSCPAAQACQAGLGATASRGGRGEAGGAVVTPADRRLVAVGLPFRSGDAGVARDDLSIAVCAEPRCAPPGAATLPADRSDDALSAGQAAAARPWAAGRHPSHQPSDPRRRPTGRCPGIGKATWCLANGPARSGPWWSATAALWCCSRYPRGSPLSACVRP